MKRNIEQMLEQELEYCYDLVKKRFSMDFVKPDIYVGEEHIRKFSIRPNEDTLMLYNDNINGIYVTNLVARHETKSLRSYVFLHELGHALCSQHNPELKISRQNELLQARDKYNEEKGIVYGLFDEEIVDDIDAKEDEEKGIVYGTFYEGFAEYIAIKSASCSKKHRLKAKAKEISKVLQKMLKEWIKVELKLGKTQRKEWQMFALDFYSGKPFLLRRQDYVVGYYFMSHLKDPDIKKIIKNPPTTIEQLIYPEEYSY